MDEQVLEFARKSGYSTIKKLGEYNNNIVYKPKGTNGKSVGFPKYIIVKDNSIDLIIDSDLELSLHFYKE